MTGLLQLAQFGDPAGGLLEGFVYPIRLIVAVFLLLIAIFVGQKLGDSAEDFSERLALGEAVAETPLGSLFDDADQVDDVVNLSVRYLVYLVGFVVAAGMANLNRLTALLMELAGYVASAIGALVVVLVGFVIAGYVARAIEAHEVLGGREITPLFSTVAKAVIYFVVVALALQELGYSTAILNTVALGVAVGLGLGVAIAVGVGVGMGSQEYVSDHVGEWLNQ